MNGNINMAIARFVEADYQGCIDLCNQSIEADPKNDLAYYYKGYSMQQLGRYDEANKIYYYFMRLDFENNKGRNTMELNPDIDIEKLSDPFPYILWSNFRRASRCNENRRVIRVDFSQPYDMITVFLESGSPIIAICTLGIHSIIGNIPLINDELIIERDGINIPIVYNISTSSYFLSDSSDRVIGYDMKLNQTKEDLLRIREQIDISMDENAIRRMLRAKSFSLFDQLFLKTRTKLRLPFILTEIISLQSEVSARSRGSHCISAKVKGEIVHSEVFHTNQFDRQGNNHLHTFLYLRISNAATNSIISVYFHDNSGRRPRLMIPPANVEIEVTGRLNMIEGILIAESLTCDGEPLII